MKKQFYKAFISLVSIFQSTTISEMSQEEAQDKEAELLGALRSSSASKKMLSVRSLREKRNLLALSTLAIVLAYGEASFDSKKQHFFGINLHNIEIDHIFWFLLLLIIYQGYQFFLSAKVDGYGNYVNEKNNLIKLVDLALASPIHRDTLADCREGDHASPWLKDKDRYSYIVQLCNNYASFVSSSASRGNSEQQKERERQKLILVNIRKKLKSEKVNAFLSHVLLDFYFPLCWALLAMGVVLRLGFKLL